MAKTKTEETLKIIPLGGIGEIGKNLTVIEYGADIIVIDCGLSFPEESMYGVDLVIPDMTYLEKNRERVRGIFITHGHEDHIGAIPYLMRLLAKSVPVYGTAFTLGLIQLKLKEHRLSDRELVVIEPGDTVRAGVFDVEFINVNHSTCSAVALAISTPAGVIVHSGDFKIDFTPVIGKPIDLQRFAQIGASGVLLLMMDSTNSERPGYTMSERTIGASLEKYFTRAEGRIIVSMFASNVQRMQTIVDLAVRFDRYVVFNGRSMVNIANLACELGELNVPEGRRIEVEDIDFYDPNEIVIVTTGSQGEELAGLTRMAFSEHRKLEVEKSDLIILSSTPVPGNEKYVARVINQLFKRGANVVYEEIEDVHVSGHACQAELKTLHALIRPKYFMPVHGEDKHLHSHTKLAIDMGMPEENIIRIANGNVLEFVGGAPHLLDSVPSGGVMVDGLDVGGVGNVVLRDRKLLSQDGIITVVAAVDFKKGELRGEPELISRGFVYEKESEELLADAREVVSRAVWHALEKKKCDENVVRGAIRDELRSYINQKTKRAPMIISVVVPL